MFKVNFTTDTTATLTPSRLLMMDSSTNTDWNFNAPTSVNEFNSYMNEMNPFDDHATLFSGGGGGGGGGGGSGGGQLQKYPQPTQEQQERLMVHSPQEAAHPASPIPDDTTDAAPPQKKQRNKILEKNREAAYRCRQKKKKWVNDLEERSEKAENQNKELQQQVAQLREESIYLRNLLLTHGNCDCDVVQTYLRRTSEQLSMTTAQQAVQNVQGAQTGQLPGLVNSSSSVSGSSESPISSSATTKQQFYNPTTIQPNFMLQ